MNFIDIFGNGFKASFPELFLVFSILVLLVYGVVYSSLTKYNKESVIINISWLGTYILLITILLVQFNPFTDILIFKDLLAINYFTNCIKIVILASSALVLIISRDYLKKEKIVAFEYVILILLATLGLLLIISSYDFLALYLAIELTSLCLYVLAAFNRNSELSTEAGLKYFILGAFASGFLLFGFSIVYRFTGITNFGDIEILFSNLNTLNGVPSTAIIVAIVFIFSGLLFKLAAVPFHMWAPDVYEGSPTSVTAFFAIVPKIAIVGILTKLAMSTFSIFIEQWQLIIIFSALGSLIIGTFLSLYQQTLKRLVAYSAISHIGYLLVGLASGLEIGLQGVYLYMLVYILMSLGFFSIILNLRNKVTNEPVKYITDLAGLSKSNPIIAFLLAILLFSMAGIPPLAGFYSKLYIFLSAIEASLYVVAIVGVLCSVIGSIYYIRIVKLMYFEPALKDVIYEKLDTVTFIILSSICLFLASFFLYPAPIFIIISNAISSFIL